MLHVGRDKIYYLIRTGQLRSIKIGKLRRITEDHLALIFHGADGCRWRSSGGLLVLDFRVRV
jgi:excisionase family DNA binding protein